MSVRSVAVAALAPQRGHSVSVRRHVENVIRHPSPLFVPDVERPVPIYDIMAVVLLAIAMVGFVNWLMGV